jgi:NitT/TauT family transport system substrate-binding protein
MKNYQQKKGSSIPGFPKRWTFGFQLLVLIIVLSLVGGGVYLGYPYLNKIAKGSSADIRGGMNNFVGFAPGIWMNNGLNPNKESRMYKEFGITAEFVVQDDMNKLVSALKSGELDFIFTTTDISPISMDASSDLARMNVQQFLKIDDSRGADLFIVDESIKSIADLRGKKIACALGWPSNTLLHSTLEAGGLSENDVNIITFADPLAAKNAYISGNVDATVVWSPDDVACLQARRSRVLTSTEFMPNIIMDGFIARKEVLEKKKDEFVALSKAWLTANAEMSISSNMEAAAQVFKVAFNVEDPVKDVVDGMKKIHFATYGDNLNFFGLSTDFTGITGQMLYNKMSRVYKNGYGNNLSNIVPWAQASNPSIIQAITDLTGEIHAAESQVKFTPASSAIASAPAIATKRLTVNFATNSYILTTEEKMNLDRDIAPYALELSGFRIRIEGNTDNTGNRENNIVLSQKRAQAVADYLVSEYKFDRNRFVIVGNGPDKPVSDNSTETGRAANRRTDFEFIGK